MCRPHFGYEDNVKVRRYDKDQSLSQHTSPLDTWKRIVVVVVVVVVVVLVVLLTPGSHTH